MKRGKSRKRAMTKKKMCIAAAAALAAAAAITTAIRIKGLYDMTNRDMQDHPE